MCYIRTYLFINVCVLSFCCYNQCVSVNLLCWCVVVSMYCISVLCQCVCECVSPNESAPRVLSCATVFIHAPGHVRPTLV